LVSAAYLQLKASAAFHHVKRMASGINHGTKTKPKSFKRCNSILSDAECLKIKSSDLSKINLSKKYNVHISTIYRAITHADELLKQLEEK
jgi:hypothetical protein